jgi:hypothetical protein
MRRIFVIQTKYLKGFRSHLLLARIAIRSLTTSFYYYTFRKANLQSIMKWMKVRVLDQEESLKFAQRQTSKELRSKLSFS